MDNDASFTYRPPPLDAAALSTRRAGRKPSPEKKVRILEAAIQLFTTQDYHCVTMDEIADRAAVGKGTVYRYFPTKEALFLALVELAVSRAGEVIRTGLNDSDAAITRLRRAVMMTIEYFRRNEPFLAILYHEKVFRSCRERKELEQRRAELRGVFVRLLAEGIVEGSIRSDMEPLMGAIVLMSAVRGFLRNFGETRTSEQLADQLLSIFIDGAAKRKSNSDATATLAKTRDSNGRDADAMARLDPLASLASVDGHAELPTDLTKALPFDSSEFDEGSSGVQMD